MKSNLEPMAEEKVIKQKCATILSKNTHACELRLKTCDEAELKAAFYALAENSSTKLSYYITFFRNNCCKMKTNQKLFFNNCFCSL